MAEVQDTAPDTHYWWSFIEEKVAVFKIRIIFWAATLQLEIIGFIITHDILLHIDFKLPCLPFQT